MINKMNVDPINLYGKITEVFRIMICDISKNEYQSISNFLTCLLAVFVYAYLIQTLTS